LFDQGMIVYIDCEPSAGKEITKRRPALIVSINAYNKSGMALVCPITTKERSDNAVFIDLPDGLPVTGQINTMQVRCFDLEARNAEPIGPAPDETLQMALSVIQRFIGR